MAESHASENTPLVKRRSGTASSTLAEDTLAATFEFPNDNNGSLAMKTVGCAPVELFGEEYAAETSIESVRDRSSSLIFSKRAVDEIERDHPQSFNFLQTHAGALYQFLLLFVYIHFDAGLPILQDIYKKCFGNGELLFTKQTLLISQNALEIVCIFIIARIYRGSIKDCINPAKSFKFAPAGACFGIQAVFGFMAMGELTADCYALYAQMSIVVLTFFWCVFFRTHISGICWMGIFTILIGFYGFNLSDDKTSLLGLTYIGVKVIFQSFAAIYAEAFLKADSEVLYIQMAWLKPVELLTTVVMMFVIPPKPGKLSAIEEIHEGGFFHHWNFMVVIIMVFNMGDTFMTAAVAKKFDSVVKGVAGIFDIIYPTQLLVYLIDRPQYPVGKILSGLTIMAGSLTFVLGKRDMKKVNDILEKVKLLEKQVGNV